MKRYVLIPMLLFLIFSSVFAQRDLRWSEGDSVIFPTILLEQYQDSISVEVYMVTSDTITGILLPLGWRAPARELCVNDIILGEPFDKWSLRQPLFKGCFSIELDGAANGSPVYTGSKRILLCTVNFAISRDIRNRLIPLSLNSALYIESSTGIRYRPRQKPGYIIYHDPSRISDSIPVPPFIITSEYQPAPYNPSSLFGIDPDYGYAFEISKHQTVTLVFYRFFFERGIIKKELAAGNYYCILDYIRSDAYYVQPKYEQCAVITRDGCMVNRIESVRGVENGGK